MAQVLIFWIYESKIYLISIRNILISLFKHGGIYNENEKKEDKCIYSRI